MLDYDCGSGGLGLRWKQALKAGVGLGAGGKREERPGEDVVMVVRGTARGTPICEFFAAVRGVRWVGVGMKAGG